MDCRQPLYAACLRFNPELLAHKMKGAVLPFDKIYRIYDGATKKVVKSFNEIKIFIITIYLISLNFLI